jgi:ankyrin repeat protein
MMKAWLSLVLATSPVPPAPVPVCEGAIFVAIEKGDVAQVQRAVTPATLDTPGTGRCAKRTPLLAAAEWGRLEVVDALLSLGADVNFTVVEKFGPQRWRVTAECLALSAGHDDVVALLRQRGAADTVDGCRRRASLEGAVRAADPVRLAKERKAGNRLSDDALLWALRLTDCASARAYCAELIRHLPPRASPARDLMLDELEQWVGVMPGLEQQLKRLPRSE